MVPVVELWGVPASTSTATAMLFGGSGGRRIALGWPRPKENRAAKNKKEYGGQKRRRIGRPRAQEKRVAKNIRE